jgi:hypothetical protein
MARSDRYERALTFYNALVNASQNNNGTYVFTGRARKVYEQSVGKDARYNDTRKVLMKMHCIEIISEGRGTGLAEWNLVLEPTTVAFDQYIQHEEKVGDGPGRYYNKVVLTEKLFELDKRTRALMYTVRQMEAAIQTANERIARLEEANANDNRGSESVPEVQRTDGENKGGSAP